jgi:hypothetical protein
MARLGLAWTGMAVITSFRAPAFRLGLLKRTDDYPLAIHAA